MKKQIWASGCTGRGGRGSGARAFAGGPNATPRGETVRGDAAAPARRREQGRLVRKAPRPGLLSPPAFVIIGFFCWAWGRFHRNPLPPKSPTRGGAGFFDARPPAGRLPLPRGARG
ncbi:uncharacterized protein TM35_001481000 [Trypanosoma theileri]|uniref:Uncharacterized protein n=1 Tax=Trypanosoma theileri TaxID=67003 RepID=A0A1X0NF73_9TRYP|nr:uncharacterized protein TM35_001481000 [Trypanosoma theileri]ORC80727.1 hypothetical protein TM35_001481000 [Trypanosoma theileri]